MNSVNVTGNLAKDIVLQATPSGTKVVSNTIAVRRNRKNSSGEYDTDFINFVAWDVKAEYLSKYAKKGDKIELTGTWQVRNYETDKGEKKRIDELIVETVNVWNVKEKEEKKEEEKLPTYKEVANQLPF